MTTPKAKKSKAKKSSIKASDIPSDPSTKSPAKPLKSFSAIVKQRAIPHVVYLANLAVIEELATNDKDAYNAVTEKYSSEELALKACDELKKHFGFKFIVVEND